MKEIYKRRWKIYKRIGFIYERLEVRGLMCEVPGSARDRLNDLSRSGGGFDLIAEAILKLDTALAVGIRPLTDV